MDAKPNPVVGAEEIARLTALCEKATEGPWCIDSVGEKGDGANIIGVAFGPDDHDCKNPLSGWLQPFDEDGEEINYYRDEAVAVCEHRDRNAAGNAAFIAALNPKTVIALLTALTSAREEIERIAEVIEPHWRGAGLKAEASWIIAEIVHIGKRLDDAEDERDALREALTRLTEQAEALEFSAYPAHGTGLVVIVTGGNTAELKIASMKARSILSPPDEKRGTPP